jgi:hypothetical protein
MNNSIKRKLIGSLIVVILAIAIIILFTWYEISTQPVAIQPDLSKIKINQREGDYLLDGKILLQNFSIIGGSSTYTRSVIASKILLLNYSLNYTTLKREDICFPYSANSEDPGIVIRGALKNEYDKDYWIILGAAAYDSNENLLGRSLDSGPICGIIARHVESNMTENFELHLKFNNTISKINLSGSISEICPP